MGYALISLPASSYNLVGWNLEHEQKVGSERTLELNFVVFK